MLEQTAYYLCSAILGIMLFFSFVLAPVTFNTLNEENARIFIRRIFPFYYNVNLLVSILVIFLLIYLKIFNLDFFLILIIAILFALSNYVLMPLINKYRDGKQEKKFKFSHLISVIINFIQILFLVMILI